MGGPAIYRKFDEQSVGMMIQPLRVKKVLWFPSSYIFFHEHLNRNRVLKI